VRSLANESSSKRLHKMNYVLSFGAGVNTTCLLLLLVEKRMPCDKIIFADTGAEHPETYEYIHDKIEPFCRDQRLQFETVRTKLPPLEEYCIAEKATPSRTNRWCTDKWKIRPIYSAAPQPCTFYMGICWDEVHRIHDPHQRGFGKVFFNHYPLIDWRMTRNDCIRIIEEYGWKVPIKSGCFFCPFQRLEGWRDLFMNHLDLYERAIAVEKADKSYPKYCLPGNGMPLERLRMRWGHGDSKIDDWLPTNPCDSGFCMV